MGIFLSKPKQEPRLLPVLILEDLVCFPQAVVPLYVSNKTAIKAVETAMAGDRAVLVAYARKGHEIQGRQSLADVATLGKISQILRLPNNTSRVVLEAGSRVRLLEVMNLGTEPQANYDPLEVDNTVNDEVARLMRHLSEQMRHYASLHKKVPPETMAQVDLAETPHGLMDLVLGNATLEYQKKLALLEEVHTLRRLEETTVALGAEIQLLELRNEIQTKVKKRLENNQKEYFINEQIKELHREIGKEDDDQTGVKELEARLRDLPLPAEVAERAKSELKRLGRLSPLTPEAGIVRNYLELLAELPWGNPEEPSFRLDEASRVLDEDHYDLEEAKDRILDYLAARSFNPAVRSPILCFVGPPGTGKTSLGRSIARALGRSFVRISLGGVRDEAEIRGHRKTYVGALPGKILQGMRKAKTNNPVFLLDELDKLANDHRGDPSSALLEVLDPEQNHSFSDHYLELPYDLSRVLFIATANNLGAIPGPLRDRMELVEIPGYTPFEKQRIAQDFIIPRQTREHGVEGLLAFSPKAITTIIETYTNEAGVRQLDRSIVKCIRKALRDALGPAQAPSLPTQVSLDPDQTESPTAQESPAPEVDSPAPVLTRRTLEVADITRYLKKPRIPQDVVREDLPPGLAYGLAWTETGGAVLPVEVALTDGKGDFILTGSLGDVMKESARIALSLIRSQRLPGHERLSDGKALDVHIHVPEGATPKDGPSAGITLTTALVGALSGRGMTGLMAMTGEITLTGRVLAIGGLREKVLAAHRLGFTRIAIPEANRHDTERIPAEVLDDVKLIYCHSIRDVLASAFPIA